MATWPSVFKVTQRPKAPQTPSRPRLVTLQPRLRPLTTFNDIELSHRLPWGPKSINNTYTKP